MKKGNKRNKKKEKKETHISGYGKTIGIKGQTENANLARQSIENLLKGGQHRNIYHWLEKKRKELKKKEFQKEDIEIKESFTKEE